MNISQPCVLVYTCQGQLSDKDNCGFIGVVHVTLPAQLKRAHHDVILWKSLIKKDREDVADVF